MTSIELKVEKRDKSENLDKLRASGYLPAVLYGPKDEPVSIKLPLNEFLRAWHEAGESTIIDIKGLDEDKEVLIKEVQMHPVKDLPIHVDFYSIERGKTLTLYVPLEFVGEAPAEKKGGIVVRVMHEIEIETRPRNIPQHIEVDLSKLEDLDSIIAVKDLDLPEGVVALADPEEVVASVSAQQEETEETTEETGAEATEEAASEEKKEEE